MKPSDFPHASESFKRLNPHLFGLGPVPATVAESAGRRPASDTAGKAGGERGIWKRRLYPRTNQKLGRVLLLRVAHRELDDDNLTASLKHLRDAIADSLLPGLPAGRADAFFRWEYGQCETRGEEGVVVKIEL